MYREKIDSYIDSKREEILSDLTDLVKINSQRGEALPGKPFGEGPAEVIAAAEALLIKYGFKTTNYDNYVVTGDLSEQEKGLDVLAHLDVVPVTDTWTVTEPFTTKIIDGKIYGRGTADDKGPALAALYALRAIKELGIPMKKSVRLILGSDEECGSSDLKYYYNIEKEAPYSFTPDADFPVINIEKGRLAGAFFADFAEELQLPCVLSFESGDKVNVVPQKARMIVAGLDEAVLNQTVEELNKTIPVTVEVTADAECANEDVKQQITELQAQKVPVFAVEVRGKAAHASTPQDGVNALTAALRMIAGLPLAETAQTKALRALDQVFPYEDVSGRSLGIFREEKESGQVTVCFSILNCTTKRMDGFYDSRLPIGCNDENTKDQVEKVLTAHRITVKDIPMIQPHCVPGDSDFVKTLLDSYERYTGIKGKPLPTGGGTYVHHLERGVAYGCMTPDVDNHMHGDDEFMGIDTLLMSAKIFADAMIKICNEL